MAEPLSPAAQAIRQINDDQYDQPVLSVIAAALEALADQVTPEGRMLMIRMPETDVGGLVLGGMLLTAEPNDRLRADILRIAAELRGNAE